jgi:hypothetical protein
MCVRVCVWGDAVRVEFEAHPYVSQKSMGFDPLLPCNPRRLVL